MAPFHQHRNTEAALPAANAFLATKLSFTNAIAALCEAVGADVNDVLLGMGYDHRIGHEFLRPGPGWGGSCLPKDSKAIISIADDAGYDFALMRGVIEANVEQFGRIVRKVESVTSLNGATVGVLGIAFKAGTDDTRESPAIEVMKRLLAKGLHKTLAASPDVDDYYKYAIQIILEVSETLDKAQIFLDRENVLPKLKAVVVWGADQNPAAAADMSSSGIK